MHLITMIKMTMTIDSMNAMIANMYTPFNVDTHLTSFYVALSPAMVMRAGDETGVHTFMCGKKGCKKFCSLTLTILFGCQHVVHNQAGRG
jgi:hypothetical protein